MKEVFSIWCNCFILTCFYGILNAVHFKEMWGILHFVCAVLRIVCEVLKGDIVLKTCVSSWKKQCSLMTRPAMRERDISAPLRKSPHIQEAILTSTEEMKKGKSKHLDDGLYTCASFSTNMTAKCLYILKVLHEVLV